MWADLGRRKGGGGRGVRGSVGYGCMEDAGSGEGGEGGMIKGMYGWIGRWIRGGRIGNIYYG